MLRRFLFAFVVTILLLFVVVACIEPTPTVSPLPTPTVSPLVTPAVGPLVAGDFVEYIPIEMEENKMTLVELLTTLAAGGLLGGIIAFLAERSQWFQNLTSVARFWVIGAISIGLPLVAQALLLNVPAEFWAALEPYWQAILAGGTVWLGSQLVHKFLK